MDNFPHKLGWLVLCQLQFHRVRVLYCPYPIILSSRFKLKLLTLLKLGFSLQRRMEMEARRKQEEEEQRKREEEERIRREKEEADRQLQVGEWQHCPSETFIEN